MAKTTRRNVLKAAGGAGIDATVGIVPTENVVSRLIETKTHLLRITATNNVGPNAGRF
jgi:hypothetical protein